MLATATALLFAPSLLGTVDLTQTPSITAEVSSAAWPSDAVVYHVFVDRFADGDASLNVEQPDDHADALTGWMGGDLPGVRARLGHIAELGANTIWLSPVSPGPYHHGYHPTDLNAVNENFGDLEQLTRLVDDAHELGMRVVYDLVLNHTSDRHPWFVDATEYCEQSAYEAWYRFRSCPESYAAFAGLDELPQLDLDHPPLRRHVFEEVLPFWLDEVGVDGFRLDHVQGPSRDFWTAFRDEIDERWPGTLLLGEVWASQPIIDTYGEVLDAATAFPLRERLIAVFARGGDVRAIAQPVAALERAGQSVPRPATYLSSHDEPRFTFVAGGDTRRTALAYAAILTMPGLPVIYYGDEVGLSQTGDHADEVAFQDRWFREPMPWDEQEWDEPLLERLSALARLRTSTPALHAGDHLDVLAEGEVWVFERRLGDQRVLVALNTSEDAVSLEVAELYGEPLDDEVALTDLLSGEAMLVFGAPGGSLPLMVDALGVAVLGIHGPLPAPPVPSGTG